MPRIQTEILHYIENQEDLKQKEKILSTDSSAKMIETSEKSDKDCKAAIMNASTSNNNMTETNEKEKSSAKRKA